MFPKCTETIYQTDADRSEGQQQSLLGHICRSAWNIGPLLEWTLGPAPIDSAIERSVLTPGEKWAETDAVPYGDLGTILE